MNKLSVLLIIFVMSSTVSFGQTGIPIESKKVLGEYQFYQRNVKLNMKQLVFALQTNEKAFQQVKKAQSSNNLAKILGFSGGFLVGWAAISGGEPNWTLIGVGGGLAVIAIPFALHASKNAKLAVDIYNEGLQPSANVYKPKLKLLVHGNSVGLCLNF